MAVPLFPSFPGIAFPVQRTPVLASLRQKAVSGRSTFQPLWPQPLWKYQVSFAVLTAAQGSAWGGSAEFQTLAGFWVEAMTSPGGLFAYVDPGDNAAAGQFIAWGDGVTRSFQLSRTMGGSAEPVLYPMPAATVPGARWDYGSAAAPLVPAGAAGDCGSCTAAPDAADDLGYCSSLQLYGADPVGWPTPPVLEGWNWANGAADASGGVIEFATAPGAGVPLYWSGGYGWLCQFDEDSLEFENFLAQLWSLKSCAFTTVRL